MYFFAILSTLFFIGSTVAEFEAFFKEHGYDVNNLDPFWLAQELMVDEPLVPDRHVFEKIDTELKSIRASNPHLVDVHHKPPQAPGRVYLWHYDMKALNESSYGPIEILSNEIDTGLYNIAFKRPYYMGSGSSAFDTIIDGFRDPNAYNWESRSADNRPSDGYIRRVPNVMDSTIEYKFVRFVIPCYLDDNCDAIAKNEWDVVIDDN